ncbi:TadE/TadG family type IV pilus assembly protein [Elusimicrobiota bacterium]
MRPFGLSGGVRRGRSGRGQVLVEVLLMLPFFCLMVFTIMEVGHLAFRTILLHHAAYEVARIGSLSAMTSASPGCAAPALDGGRMQQVAKSILTDVTMYPALESTLSDPQEGCAHYDVVVTMTQPVPMIFPMTGMILANTSDRRHRSLAATVRMPVERPLFK